MYIINYKTAKTFVPLPDIYRMPNLISKSKNAHYRILVPPRFKKAALELSMLGVLECLTSMSWWLTDGSQILTGVSTIGVIPMILYQSKLETSYDRILSCLSEELSRENNEIGIFSIEDFTVKNKDGIYTLKSCIHKGDRLYSIGNTKVKHRTFGIVRVGRCQIRKVAGIQTLQIDIPEYTAEDLDLNSIVSLVNFWQKDPGTTSQ